MSDVVLEKVEYLKVRAPPTLNQYLLNRMMKEASLQASQFTGTVTDGTQLMPASAKYVKDTLKGLTAREVRKEHPEWVNEYPDYIKEWEKKNSVAPAIK